MCFSFEDDRLSEKLWEEDSVKRHPVSELLGTGEVANGGVEENLSDRKTDLFSGSGICELIIY